ncbi:MAG TPA: hypothetical protein VK176_08825 [Phycisphaerales bacterium]|nr:hypothetical protein [Phycisphaerales bacterium]
MKLSIEEEYRLFPLPIRTFAEEQVVREFDRDAAKQLFSDFRALIPDRLQQLQRFVVFDPHCREFKLDRSRDSLLIVSRWLVAHCGCQRAGEKLDFSLDEAGWDELQRDGTRRRLCVDITELCRSFLIDVAIYWGECVVDANPSAKWKIAVGKTVRFKNMPVLNIPNQQYQLAPWVNLTHWLLQVFQEGKSADWPVAYLYDELV